jgi:predicted Zn-dependent protease
LLAAALLSLAGWGGYEGYKSLQAWNHERAARQALTERDFKAARNHLRTCLDLRPNKASTHFLAAQAARRDGDLDAAEEHLLICQRLEDVTDDVTLEWALLLAQRGKLAEVEEYLNRRLVERDVNTPLILEVLSWEYLRVHRLAEASQLLEAWLALEPNNSEGWVRKGWIAEHLFNHAAALEAYGKALDLQPDKDSVRLRLAEILLLTNKPGDALGHLQQLFERPSDDPAVVVTLARCHRQLGRLDEARALLDDLLAARPRHSQALSERGMVAMDLNKPDQAEELLRRAADHGPFDKQILFNLYQCLERLDKKDEAAKIQARLKENEADLKRMRDIMKDVLRRPHDPAPRCEAGKIFLRNGFTDDGLHWLGTALQEDYSHQPTHQALADYYDQLGNAELAAYHKGFLAGK